MEDSILWVVLGVLIIVGSVAIYHLKMIEIHVREIDKLLVKIRWLCQDILNKIKR